jgi:hypothetical protein
MPSAFTLDLTLTTARIATLRLYDEHGRFLAASQARLAHALPSPDDLLGSAILGHLAAGIAQRTLVLRLPDPAHEPLAAELARVPWELARAPGDPDTLLAHNVVVRIALAGREPARDASVTSDPLRVLLVFAEAPGTRPLAARLERERLLDLFFGDVLPTHAVEVDVLAHGVTQACLVERIRERGGYSIVHLSGHGRDDGLLLARDDGAPGPACLPCSDLAKLFEDAGGFVPDLMVLSACHSGGTRTALALLAAGVQQIVAMRGEVGDTYARRLARRFYRNLLADRARHPVDAALSMARRELVEDAARAADYLPTDHALPIVFGGASLRFAPRARRSAQMDRRAPKPQPLPAPMAKPCAFVGRGEALAAILPGWSDRDGPPVALVLGPAGIGKTALAAEALHLGFDRFDHVLAFCAGGSALRVEDVLREAHRRLTSASVAYRAACKDNPKAAIYLPPSEGCTAGERAELLRNNLVAALSAERVLLVIDGLDAALLDAPSGAGHPAEDPAWDLLLVTLAERLRGTGSRAIVTSRLAPAAIAGGGSLRVELGLFPRAEAEVFLDADPVLRALPRGEPGGLRARLDEAGRGHPFVLGGSRRSRAGTCSGTAPSRPRGSWRWRRRSSASARRATRPCLASSATRAGRPSRKGSSTS